MSFFSVWEFGLRVLKYVVVLLSLICSQIAFGFGGSGSNPRMRGEFYTTSQGGQPGSVGGGGGYGSWNYPPGSLGPYPSGPQQPIPAGQLPARLNPTPIASNTPHVATPSVTPEVTPPRVFANFNTDRVRRMRELRFNPERMDTSRSDAIRQMVQTGNSCQGCDNPNCNRDFFDRESARICNEFPRCPCSNNCDQDLIDGYRDSYLSQMGNHETTPRGRSQDGLDYSQQRHREQSPSLQRSYPELALLGAFRGTTALVNETLALIRVTESWSESWPTTYDNTGAYREFEVPHGPEEAYRFFRLGNDITQNNSHAEIITRTRQLQGSAPEGSFTPQVQGYFGTLPENAAPGSMQLETSIRPDSVTALGADPQGAMMRWYPDTPGVVPLTQVNRVGIPVRIIRVVE